MSPESILDHFKKHFNPTNLINSVTPDELSGNLPEFARELQIISNKFLINHEVPTISEIQKHLCQSKPEKASNDVDVELLKNVNTHLCFKLFIECQITYGQSPIFLPFGVIIDLKLSGREKYQVGPW